MLLTVGELAKRCGLTVRTLHHWHETGLLVPSLRSDAGYRLYDRSCVERLHRIQALRQLGLSLTDIDMALSGPQQPLAELVARQIAQIDQELSEATRLRQRLMHLQTQLADGQSPDLADWLDTLEMMTMVEKYFSPEELERLPFHHDADVQAHADAMVHEVQAAMDRGVTIHDPEAHELALSWMRMIERGTGNNPSFLMRLNVINDKEPTARERSGITPELQKFVEQALVAARLAIFQRYLTADDMVRMRANYGKQMYAWLELIAELRQAMAVDTPTDDPHVQQLARRWGELFCAYAGTDPSTHARIREAYAKEPELRSGSAVDEALFKYVRQATDGHGDKSD